ncbi:DUF6709 family protein [Oceanirhabdus sp. W0125-5]|uniref:DUF6709 family protein n=1 Tax=Oceanirhabdus sp. W0125-5 TaxID=2999116 RepID=UPI0022F2BE12|nr:DUF6709 family protein [Oceanirhabdus sp. W0125-5]WBW94675.1 hypothetical protein OW730_13315 [Oceanirhabdus sp. W0125-5]
MEQSYFMKIYKKRWFYRFITLGCLMLVIIGLLGMGGYTYNNNINNPVMVETNEDYYDAVEKDSYVQISSKEIYDLGIVKTRSRRKLGIKISETKMYYMALELEGRLLTISLPEKIYEEINKQQTGPYLIKGEFKEYSSKDFEYIRNSLIEDGLTVKEVDTLLYSNYLDYMTPLDSVSSYLIFSGLIMVVILVVFIPIIRKNSTALKSLKKYSNGNLEKILQQIDNEIELSGVYKNKPFTITRSFLIVESNQIVFALPLSELMWVYKSTVKNKTGKKFHSLVFVFSDKGKYKVDLNGKIQIIDETIKFISENCSAPIIGYSEELDKLFKKNPDEFIKQWKMNRDINDNK